MRYVPRAFDVELAVARVAMLAAASTVAAVAAVAADAQPAIGT